MGLSFAIAAGLARTFILRSKSRGTRDHNLHSQIRDLPFRRLIDSQGYDADIRFRLHTVEPNISLHFLQLVRYFVFLCSTFAR
jgi:hypothetical protein